MPVFPGRHHYPESPYKTLTEGAVSGKGGSFDLRGTSIAIFRISAWTKCVAAPPLCPRPSTKETGWCFFIKKNKASCSL